MKKAKRIAPSGRRTIVSPPDRFLREMTALFGNGRLDLFEQKANEAIRRWPGHFMGWKAIGNLRLMQGAHAAALEPLVTAVRLAPGDAQAHHSLGIALLGLERLAEAAASFRQALALKPDYAQAHNNLGILLLECGQLEEAEASYRQALALKPDFVEAHNNLGNALKELNRSEEAEASYRQALALQPHSAETHNNLGGVLLQLGRLQEAEASYRQALALKPDYAQAHNGLGDTLVRLGRPGDAVASYRRGIALDPSLIEIHAGLDQTLSRLVPLWHVPMMNDKPRNDAYFAALQAAITPDVHVLEIGTGSGLLSMMAAKLGARKVTTCEAVPEIAEKAREIVAANGFSPPVTVVPKTSGKLDIGVDMDGRADLLVSEILSSEFLGEGVLASIEDAKRRLLKSGARVIPARGSVQFALFGGADIGKNLRVEEVYGFDLTAFNTLVCRKHFISRNDLDIDLLTADTCAFFFDFVNTDRFPRKERKMIEVPVRKAGRCWGIIQWLRLEMDDRIVFENHPSTKNPASGWQRCAYVFPTPVDVLPSQIAMVTAAHNRKTPWFSFEGLK